LNIINPHEQVSNIRVLQGRNALLRMPIRQRCQRAIKSVMYGLSMNITQICDSPSEAEKGLFSLLFGHPVFSAAEPRQGLQRDQDLIASVHRDRA
jgi:hypothetical protein